MTATAATDMLQPLTIASIRSMCDKRGQQCDCHLHSQYPSLMHLCDYHEGFEDGIYAYLEGPNE